MDNKYIIIGVAVVVIIILAKVIFRSSPTVDYSKPDLSENATDEQVLALVQQGRKMEAIKVYRGIHGVGLKEAKNAVEKMVQ